MKTLLIFAFFLLSSTVFGSNDTLKLPFIDPKHGSFASECKMPKKLRLKVDTNVAKELGSDENIATLKAGEVVTPKTQVDKVLKAGTIQILKNYKFYKKGETAYLLELGADASYRIWYKGKIAVEPHREDQDKIFSISDEEIAEMKTEMWVKVRFSKKRTGWIKFIGSDDSCTFAN